MSTVNFEYMYLLAESREVNAWIVKNVGAKFHKRTAFGTVLLTFSKTGGEVPSPPPPPTPVSMGAMTLKTEKTNKFLLLSVLKFNYF